VTFQVTGNEGWSYCVEAGPDGGGATEHPTRPPDVTVLLDPATWTLLAEGRVSPLEAFGRGGMRVRGDIAVAWEFVRRLQQPPDDTKGA
jgi:putative sterol carrier protein